MPIGVKKYGFDIPAEGLEDLSEVAEFANQLDRVQEIWRSLGISPSPTELDEATSKALNIDLSRTRKLRRGLTSLWTLLQATRLSPQELFDSLTLSMKSSASEEWYGKHIKQWTEAREQILRSLAYGQQDETTAVRSKTQELAFLRENVLLSCRLITEMRPIFNKAADKVANNILTTSLVVRYRSSDSQTKEIFFALDADDLDDLRGQCERAERKIATIEKTFGDAAWPLKILGERLRGTRDE
jgi:hypothetical protein